MKPLQSDTDFPDSVISSAEEDNDNHDDYVDDDDSNKDYVISDENNNDSSDSDTEDNSIDTNDNKCIVNQTQLDKLLHYCQVCSSPVSELHKSTHGSMITVHTLCLQNHEHTWKSQPTNSKNIPEGNILIPAAILCTGGTFQVLHNFAKSLKLNFISKASFYKTQDNIVLPIIEHQYKEQQQTVINDIKSRNQPVDLCAKYGTYSVMDEISGRILDFSLVHVSEVNSSNAMEYEGCKRSLNNLLSQNVNIRCLTTDRHTQITAQLKANYPNIVHQYDVWHLAKWVTKKLTKQAKSKAKKELEPWIHSISNHLWWCVKECKKDPQVLVSTWVSIVNHVVNKHKWRENKSTVSCPHPKLTKQQCKEIQWLKSGSPAHVALEEVVYNKNLLRDIVKLTEYHHTGNLEVFHSLLLKYAPKRKHFSYQGMVGRTQLAVMDHNTNSDRQQATSKGENRYKVVFPKNRKTWVAKPIPQEKSFGFVTK